LELEDLEFIKDRLKTITRQVTNCIQISRRYLGFLRQHPEDSQHVGVNQMLTDLGHLLRVHPSLHANEFTVQPLPQDISVRMNGTDVIQVLLNLAVNAFQCSVQTHLVEISASVLSQPLDLAALRDGPQDRFLNWGQLKNTVPLLALSVRDNGPGIAEDILPRIFHPYFTTKSARHGTGLGLNIVQRLVKEAKGALLVHTEIGVGTTFTVYLPAVA
jgi:signal transduction histidine kinase